jgi:diadenosine tetraphosphate (Ap4A) HIT family hydrolase
MSDPSTCPFCSPAERVLKHNEQANVILSNPHKVPGHILVIPKRHVEKPWELTHEELTDIFDLIFFVEQKMIGNLGEGADIRQHYRPYLDEDGLRVNHVAFHVVPRSPNDYIYTVAEQFEDNIYADLDAAEAKAVADLLK